MQRRALRKRTKGSLRGSESWRWRRTFPFRRHRGLRTRRHHERSRADQWGLLSDFNPRRSLCAKASERRWRISRVDQAALDAGGLDAVLSLYLSTAHATIQQPASYQPRSARDRAPAARDAKFLRRAPFEHRATDGVLERQMRTTRRAALSVYATLIGTLHIAAVKERHCRTAPAAGAAAARALVQPRGHDDPTPPRRKSTPRKGNESSLMKASLSIATRRTALCVSAKCRNRNCGTTISS